MKQLESKRGKIKKLHLEYGTPRIAVSFRDQNPTELFEGLKDSGIDIAELRVDLFSSFEAEEVLKEVLRFHKIPTLLTIRSKEEEGGWTHSEQERLSLFQTLIPHVNAVDIELGSEEILEAVLECAEKNNVLKIVSHHNFNETPSLTDLEKLVCKAKQKGADLVKIAVQVSGDSDLMTLTQLLLNFHQENLIVIGMGNKGLISRAFFPALGSLITFAYMNHPTAPGQLKLNQMSSLLDLLFTRPS